MRRAAVWLFACQRARTAKNLTSDTLYRKRSTCNTAHSMQRSLRVLAATARVAATLGVGPMPAVHYHQPVSVLAAPVFVRVLLRAISSTTGLHAGEGTSQPGGAPSTPSPPLDAFALERELGRLRATVKTAMASGNLEVGACPCSCPSAMAGSLPQRGEKHGRHLHGKLASLPPPLLPSPTASHSCRAPRLPQPSFSRVPRHCTVPSTAWSPLH